MGVNSGFLASDDGRMELAPVCRFASSVGDVLAHLLWPSRCAACDVLVPGGAAFCSPCEGTLLVADPACPRCALPTDDGGSCPLCSTRPPAFDRAFAALVYGGALADAIVGLKHAGRRHAARALGAFVVPLLEAGRAAGADLVLPVPLHPRKLRARGFNQALALVRAAGRRRLPVSVDALVRTRDTPELGHAGPRERRERVAGAFAVRTPDRVRGRHVLVVDDVMTTGATLGACAEALRAAGARSVSVAALARAP
jgi:ComF family protein